MRFAEKKNSYKNEKKRNFQFANKAKKTSSYSLQNIKSPKIIKPANNDGFQVIRIGFEPMTHSLEGCCSIQLSYQTVVFSAANIVV